MPAMPSIPTWHRLLIVTSSIFLTMAALYFGRAVFIPLVLAVLLTFILTPLVNWLQHRGLGRIPSVVLSVLLACAVVVAITWGVVLQVQNLAAEIPKHKDEILHKLESLKESVNTPWWEDVQHTVQEVLDRLRTSPSGSSGQVVVVPDADYWSVLLSALGPVLETLIHAGLVLILVIFMLIGREDLRNRLLRLSGTRHLTTMTRALDDVSGRITRFLSRQLLVNSAFGLIIGSGLLVIGVPFAFLFGFVAGLLRYIPYLGAWLAAVLPAALALAIFPGWTPLFLVLALFIVVETVFANFVEPYVYGRSIGVSEIALLIAAVFWAWLWGPIGLLLTTPLTACLAVVGRYIPYFEFLDVLLGDHQPLETSVIYFQRLLARDHDEATDIVETYLKDHTPEAAYDELFVPALSLAKTHFHRGELSRRDLRYICQTTYDILVDTVAPERRQKQPAANNGPVEKLQGARAPARKCLLVGVPARDETDHIALHMLTQLLEDSDCRLQILSAKSKPEDVLSAARRHHPAAVCILALPPGGLAQTRSLCRKLRAIPSLKIFVGCGDREPQVLQRLAHYADELATSLRDLRERVLHVLTPHDEAERKIAVKS